MRILTALIGLSLLAQTEAADRDQLAGLPDIRDAEYHLVTADKIGRSFHVLVGLPNSYENSGALRYPTIYLLDGGRNFPLLLSYHKHLRLMEEVPDAILVGISYGGDTFEEGNYRSTDYTAATSEREYWGGAGNFQKFLATQLMPLIETSYRSNPDRRIVFGQSIGGQFVLYTAQTMPDLFWGHIATNPALHRNLPFFLVQHANGMMPPKLFVGTASNESPRFKKPLDRWIEHWSGVNEKPWQLNVTTLHGHTHLSANPASYRQGMMWLFSDE